MFTVYCPGFVRRYGCLYVQFPRWTQSLGASRCGPENAHRSNSLLKPLFILRVPGNTSCHSSLTLHLIFPLNNEIALPTFTHRLAERDFKHGDRLNNTAIARKVFTRLGFRVEWDPAWTFEGCVFGRCELKRRICVGVELGRVNFLDLGILQ
ncbi:hypothetical protein BCR33DRAFT_247469 [Rhizoclosmatium globosum]|uniref:Uncharacterized protein n=1 Tax=Rhizoclosmatium globosum TaxID=329046 RepID=A0A1Y2C9Z3_9FUNG|nr:hypothetical protein BCR33DRAFT_247469 [Rhizoclosmatium globosum]|eukprot:ORY43756.1 hypothetical protein BCR33DRAFT_247469 [Rhizoclosmatium globosum]